MGLLSNKIEREQLKPGDHIYSWRHAYLYAHHGIYTGEGKVIHFTRGSSSLEINAAGRVPFEYYVTFSSSTSNYSLDNPCPICGYEKTLAGVVSSCLDCFLWGGELYLFKYGVSAAFFVAKVRGGTCSLATSDPPDNVLHRASYLFRNGGFGVYDLFKNNCEDFATYCKTGLLVVLTPIRSGQAVSLLAATSAIALTASFTGLVVVGFGMYCVSRLVSDIGVRCDAAKVQVEKLVARSHKSSVLDQ